MGRSFSLEGKVPNVQGNSESSGMFKSYAVSGYEEKVAAYARRALHEEYVQIESKVGVEISISSTVAVNSAGVAKAVLDGLSGVIFKDDKIVKRLVLKQLSPGKNPPGIEIKLQSLSDDLVDNEVPRFPLIITVPHSPFEKGLCYRRPLDNRSGLRKIGVESSLTMMGEPKTAQEYSGLDLIVKARSSVGDIDNVLRGYLEHSKLRGVCTNLLHLQRYSIRLYDGLDWVDKSANDLAIVRFSTTHDRLGRVS